MTHDLIISGGTVIDGTGAEGRRADVAVEDLRVQLQLPREALEGPRSVQGEVQDELSGGQPVEVHSARSATTNAFLLGPAVLEDLEDELSVMDTMDEDGLLDGACVNSGELAAS